MDRGYFKEYFDQWLAHKSRFRSWQRQLAAALLFSGFIVLFFFDFHPYLSLALLMGGVVEMLEFYWYRHNWLAQRMSARRENSKFHGAKILSLLTSALTRPAFTSKALRRAGICNGQRLGV